MKKEGPSATGRRRGQVKLSLDGIEYALPWLLMRQGKGGKQRKQGQRLLGNMHGVRVSLGGRAVCPAVRSRKVSVVLGGEIRGPPFLRPYRLLRPSRAPGLAVLHANHPSALLLGQTPDVCAPEGALAGGCDLTTPLRRSVRSSALAKSIQRRRRPGRKVGCVESEDVWMYCLPVRRKVKTKSFVVSLSSCGRPHQKSPFLPPSSMPSSTPSLFDSQP